MSGQAIQMHNNKIKLSLALIISIVASSVAHARVVCGVDVGEAKTIFYKALCVPPTIRKIKEKSNNLNGFIKMCNSDRKKLIVLYTPYSSFIYDMTTSLGYKDCDGQRISI